MNLKNVKNLIKNIPGWRTNRKIVVIESDDWGSIRMPSRDVYEKCLKAGYRVDQNPYERFDSLASEEDLELLFELLSSFKDSSGNNPVITANCLVANPDFDKIEKSGFEEYFFELIMDTFRKYPKHGKCLDIWKEGMNRGVFFPQSHGREHLNVSEFMRDIQNRIPHVLFGFNNQMPGSIPHEVLNGENHYVEALRFINEIDKYEKQSILLEGLNLFESIFGFRSESFIPPNYFWSKDFDEAMSREGVRFYQGRRKMIELQLTESKKIITHKLGEKNRYNQRYLIRNVHFEPALSSKNGWDVVDQCLSEISTAFRLRKPAIICSHRINFVGFIDSKNRDRNLLLLQKLLFQIKRNWIDVEFMTSDELGQTIEN